MADRISCSDSEHPRQTPSAAKWFGADLSGANGLPWGTTIRTKAPSDRVGDSGMKTIQPGDRPACKVSRPEECGWKRFQPLAAKTKTDHARSIGN
jgi:hypothetical protein